MTKKFLAVLAVCIVLAVAGWKVWDVHFRLVGDDDFDKAFWQQFDAAQITANLDLLLQTGLFEESYSDNQGNRQARWPVGGGTDSPSSIHVNSRSEIREDRSAHSITWEQTKWNKALTSLRDYKYLYSFYFVTPSGEISYDQPGNSRRECMETARETLLWLMSLVETR